MIDREKVIGAVETCFDSWIDKHRNMGLDLHEVERFKREALELLQAPEIVRCKDCKWYDERISMCDNCGLPREQTFFCADGRRKVKWDGKPVL